jgi:hypothetical protein
LKRLIDATLSWLLSSSLSFRAEGLLMTNINDILYRELDHRSGDGLDVRMLWRPFDDTIHVAVSDEKTGEAFSIQVSEGERAREVFHHPYAYAATRRSLQAQAA